MSEELTPAPMMTLEQFIEHSCKDPEYVLGISRTYAKRPPLSHKFKEIPYQSMSNVTFAELTKDQVRELRGALNDFLETAQDSQHLILNKTICTSSFLLELSSTQEVKPLTGDELRKALEQEHRNYTQHEIEKLRKFYLG